MDTGGIPGKRRAGGWLLTFFFCLSLAGPAPAAASWRQATEDWVRVHTFGSIKGYYRPNGIRVDRQGSVYVTGNWGFIKYSPDGLELWNRLVKSRASALDDRGNCYLTEAGVGYVTSKYDSNGALLWKFHYQGPFQYGDEPVAITVDGQGNVYVTGSSMVSTNLCHYATIKISPNGVLIWAARYHGPGNVAEQRNSNVPSAIVVDHQGNVYVTGDSTGVNLGEVDYATIKYNRDGQKLWVRRYRGPGKWQDIPVAMAADDQGNVHVTGMSYSIENNSYDFATIKYGPDGQRLWVRRYKGERRYNDEPKAIALDSRGNVYVTGVSDGNCTTIKYSPDGQELWVRRYPESRGEAIAVDNWDNIYVTGASNRDYLTIMYNPNGRQLWVKSFNGPEGNDDFATAMAVDDYGNVFVTGCTYSSWGPPYWFYDYCTIRYRQHPRSPY